jgi:hypothetical protein
MAADIIDSAAGEYARGRTRQGKRFDLMWNLFNQKRELNAEVYGKLRPGDLYGGGQLGGRQPEEFARYLMVANASALTFFAIVLSRVEAGVRGHDDIYGSVWLTAIGFVIALSAWILFRLSRAEEGKLMSRNPGNVAAEALPADVKDGMKRAAIKKLLGYRVMIVSALSGCIALYVGIKGLIIL